MTLHTQTVRSHDGVNLHVVTLGQPERPAIVCVHGYPDNHQVWLPVAERLAQDYFVVLYDVRGAGQSDRPSRIRDYQLPTLAKDLEAVVAATLPHRTFHLVAHDWGSIQTWESVTGDALNGKILSYTTLSGPSLDHAAMWMRARLGSLSFARQRQAFKQIVSSWYIAAFQLPVFAPMVWQLGLGKLWPQYLAWREGVTEPHPNATQTADGRYGVQLYRANFIPRLLNPKPRKATCPVQLIVLRQDAYVNDTLFADLHQWVDQLYRRDLDATHWAILSQPSQLAGWISEFVDGIEHGQTPAA